MAEIPRNPSFCLATRLSLFLSREIPGRGLVQYIASQAKHHQKISSKTNFEKSCTSTGSPSTSVTYMGLMDLRICRAFSAGSFFGEPFLGLASSA